MPLLRALALGAVLSTIPAACIDDFELGDTDGEVVLGTSEPNYQFPWVVHVDGNLACHGTLITDRWVLTAAHCVYNRLLGVTVSYQRRAPDGSSTGGEVKTSPGSVFMHPDYDASKSDNDIALVELPHPFPADPWLQIAELPFMAPYADQIGTVATPTTGGMSAVFRGAVYGVIEKAFMAKSSIAGLCPGDSGSGFVAQSPGRNILIGVAGSTATSSDCVTAGWEAEMMNVFGYLDWIRALTGLGVNGAVFDVWARTANARALSGDFDGDGRGDIALAGGDGWSSIPVAFSKGDGSFRVTNAAVSAFPVWANAPGAKVVVGDVNGDGRDDLIAAGGVGWSTVPVAYSTGDGSFTISNAADFWIANLAQSPGTKLLAGDVNGDGRDDLMLLGGDGGWQAIPVGFSVGNGSFSFTSKTLAGDFAIWAAAPGGSASSADIDGDGRADVVLAGGSGWSTVPMARSLGDGRWSVTNGAEPSMSIWAQGEGVSLLTGCRRAVAPPGKPQAHRCDVDANGRADVLLTGGADWTTIPVGFSFGNGLLSVTNAAVSQFPVWAQSEGVQVISGDFDGDHRADLALVGGLGWWTVPVAFSAGNGTFTVTNHAIF
jgi:hypothetical protein